MSALTRTRRGTHRRVAVRRSPFNPVVLGLALAGWVVIGLVVWAIVAVVS